jgi:hypothetical protein
MPLFAYFPAMTDHPEEAAAPELPDPVSTPQDSPL